MSENGNATIEYKFTDAELAEIEKHRAKYPDTKSAIMPALWIAQHRYGWLSKETIKMAADAVGMSFAQAYGVATFYTMYFKKPVPKFVFDICTCFTCGETGGQQVYEHAKKYLSCDANGYSADGMFYVRHAECLGACDTAPVMQVTNRHYAHNLTPEKIEKLIDEMRAGKEMTYQQIPLSQQ